MSESRFRALVVEDAPDDEAATLRALRAWGKPLETVVVRTLPDALAALGLLSPPPPPPAFHLVLCDLRGTEPEELVRRTRAEPRHADLPLVVFANSAWKAHEAACLAAGASAYAVKPIDYVAYKRAVVGLAERWIDRANGLP